MRPPRSLRTRLVVSAVALIAVVCAVIGTVTAVALRSYLYEQLDTQLSELARRAGGPPQGEHPVNAPTDPLAFLTLPGQDFGTVGATVEDGRVQRAAISAESADARGPAEVTDLTADQKAALDGVSEDGGPHTVSLPGLGDYRVAYTSGGEHGDLLVGMSTSSVDATISTLVVVELCVAGAGLVAATLAGAAMVGVALRPLTRVAATATRVSELPLHSGEPALHERVPDADPRTEVGQVGAALNRMLDHVHDALRVRQDSETRVRQFVADASHELRTPLASIRGYAELTRRGREDTGPDTRRALGRIESEATRMTVLVEDLLLLARLDSDSGGNGNASDSGGGGNGNSSGSRPGRPLSYEPTDLSVLVVDAVGDARAAGNAHVWRLELPDEPALVRADPARLHQVLVNLLANARTHTPAGTVVTARVRPGDRLRIEVEDNGPGIPAELLPHVFERFARGDASRARAAGTAEAGSTGLGLAIVRAVVAAHGGSVHVESVPGRTLFAVELPGPVSGAISAADHSQPEDSLSTLP
ncbi:HAMP domain-containing sensor histidine kinase [Streptomyces sp. N35]|uniref:HAMP domain-containing sensor histidine kinase n=1 Tax=Streptomyces sp. N35 TaxID=2795730 RepID=UPI0018F4389D|nr:HAMP domain-containing sensor histidine kinase [Streptomyces sp. N35]